MFIKMNRHVFLLFLLFGALHGGSKYYLATLDLGTPVENKQHLAIKVQKGSRSWYFITAIDTKEDEEREAKTVGITDLGANMINNIQNNEKSELSEEDKAQKAFEIQKEYSRQVIERISKTLDDSDAVDPDVLNDISTPYFTEFTADQGFRNIVLDQGKKETFVDFTKKLREWSLFEYLERLFLKKTYYIDSFPDLTRKKLKTSKP